ncbi:hypothetical protein BpHYR1_043400 [Brachionus plicatilis]|uniref:Uncharacterized protein n=1 Tax=Brachionus plicatilis TaxID=10195 RepID=A0A3M7RKQ8_BRAPC|nr:hypothetical protein BpHYR1_043400 [Brachionus plicatilis]
MTPCIELVIDWLMVSMVDFDLKILLMASFSVFSIERILSAKSRDSCSRKGSSTWATRQWLAIAEVPGRPFARQG